MDPAMKIEPEYRSRYQITVTVIKVRFMGRAKGMGNKEGVGPLALTSWLLGQDGFLPLQPGCLKPSKFQPSPREAAWCFIWGFSPLANVSLGPWEPGLFEGRL